MGRFCRNVNKLTATSRSVLSTLFLLLFVASIVTPFLHAQTAAKAVRKIVLKVDPDYPAFLRNGHFQGLVIIEATVQPNGSVSKADIKGGNPTLSQYAAAAVLHWKYAPGPEKTTEEVIFHFNANDR